MERMWKLILIGLLASAAGGCSGGGSNDDDLTDDDDVTANDDDMSDDDDVTSNDDDMTDDDDVTSNDDDDMADDDDDTTDDGSFEEDPVPNPIPEWEAYESVEVEAEDPNAGEEGEDLPLGTETDWPKDYELGTLFLGIEKNGGFPYLKYNRDNAGKTFNVKIPVPPEDIQTDGDGKDFVIMDLGITMLRIGHARVHTPGMPQIVVSENFPLEDILVLKTYGKRFDGPGLDFISLWDKNNTDQAPLGKLASDAVPTASNPDCDALAWERVGDIAPIAVNMPPISGCSMDECVETKAAWIQGNHDLFRLRQMLNYIDGRPANVRSKLWKEEASADAFGTYLHSDTNENVGPNTSLAFYFGPYADYRFQAIRWAVNHTWNRFQNLKAGDFNIDLECTPTSGADICISYGKASAHHAVISNIKLCEIFYGWEEEDKPFAQPSTIVHEMFHHVFVPWNNGTPRLDPVMDTHTHGHGVGCGLQIKTNKGYGIDEVRHLATYENSNDNDCWHQNYAFRNNDTYALAAGTIGYYVREGRIHHWPIDSHPPTPPPPPSGGGCGNIGGGSGGDEFDPLSDCYKQGQELICPGGYGGEGGVVETLPQMDIAIECPEEF